MGKDVQGGGIGLRLSSEPLHATDNGLGILQAPTQAPIDGLGHPLGGMFRQQLQHPHVVSQACRRALPHFQPFPQVGEAVGQVPGAEGSAVVQGRRTAAQGG
jgi:hypothetical protein